MYDKIHFLLLVSCIAFYFLSPDTDVPILTEDVQASEVYSTGKTTREKVESGVLSEVSIRGKENNNKENGGGNGDKSKLKNKVWTWQVIWCDASCKIETLKDLGIRPEIAESLVNECKKQDIAVVNCIKLWASIVVAESGWWKWCNKNWCFGILAKVKYDTVEEWVEDWVKRFWKHWLNQKTPDSFYSNSPDWKPKTRYCLSERQPDWTMLPYCKNGHKHAWIIFNKLNF